MGLALISYGIEEAADTLIEQMAREQDPILRYGAMYVLGMAYRCVCCEGGLRGGGAGWWELSGGKAEGVRMIVEHAVWPCMCWARPTGVSAARKWEWGAPPPIIMCDSRQGFLCGLTTV
jgi:hypothetical protein